MKVLDLFAGLGGWSAAFLDRGHDVTHVELDPVFEPEICADVFDLSPDDLGGPGAFDLVLASPPCQQFSVMRIGHNWTTDNRPKTWAAANAVRLVRHTAALIDGLEPRWFVMENPCGKLRTLVARGLVSSLMMSWERRTITYCTYGAPWMKRTDLWGGFPPTFVERDQCSEGMPCHEAAPRGMASGVQTSHLPSPRNVGGGVMPGGSASPDDHERTDDEEEAHPLVRAFYEAAFERYGIGHINGHEWEDGGSPNAGRAAVRKHMSGGSGNLTEPKRASRDLIRKAADAAASSAKASADQGGGHLASVADENGEHLTETAKARSRAAGTWDKSVLAAVRSLVPYELSLDVCMAAETSLEAGAPSLPAGRLF